MKSQVRKKKARARQAMEEKLASAMVILNPHPHHHHQYHSHHKGQTIKWHLRPTNRHSFQPSNPFFQLPNLPTFKHFPKVNWPTQIWIIIVTKDKTIIFNCKGERGGSCIGNNPEKPEKQEDFVDFFRFFENFEKEEDFCFCKKKRNYIPLWQVWQTEKRERRYECELAAGSKIKGGLLYSAGWQSCKISFGYNLRKQPSSPQPTFLSLLKKKVAQVLSQPAAALGRANSGNLKRQETKPKNTKLSAQVS